MVIKNEHILRMYAPAALAESASDEVSDRYSFLPTTEILEVLQDDGWELWKAEQVKPRKRSSDHAKHLLRLRHEDLDAQNFSGGDSFPEILIVNAHNGTSSYALRAGIFRFVCSNGMVVSEEDFGMLRIRHTGQERQEVLKYSKQFIQNSNRLADTVEVWQNTILDDRQMMQFFTDAARIRFEDPNDWTIKCVSQPRRRADHGNDLWKVYNRAQENIMRGGFQANKRRAQPVRSIDKNVKFNQELWSLASNYCEASLN